jgi:UDP-2,4-diacetamido-2,4,6-trideoxy-beta-L-altropyranose hydrolase
VFRVALGSGAGFGHFSRCLYLASLRKDFGFEAGFVLGAASDYAEGRLREQNIPYLIASGDQHAELEYIGSRFQGSDWLLVDDFNLDAAYERRARKYFPRIAVIDGMLRRHACDIWVDPSLRERGAHAELNDGECLVLCGRDYILTDPVLVEIRDRKLRAGHAAGGKFRILVNFGESSPDNTRVILLALARVGFSGEVEIIGDSSFQDGQYPFELSCRGRVGDIAGILASVRFGIGAGGVLAWERCVAGVPSLLFAVAENQNHVCRTISENMAGIAFFGLPDTVSEDELDRSLRKFVYDDRWRESLAENCLKLLDGKGVSRIARTLVEHAG